MKTKLSFLLWPSAMFICVSCSSDKQISDWTRASDFIFQGMVKVLHTTTVEVDDDAYGLAVVTVGNILDGGPAFSALTGEDVTIKAKNIWSLKEGKQYVFFAKNWVLGDEVGVVEIGHLAGPNQTGPTEEKVKATHMKDQDDDLTARLKAAEIVVLAEVVDTKPLERDNSEILSEHTPEWVVANLEIREVLKGNSTLKTTRVHFANSDDVMWYRAPKLGKGQTGVLLLQRPTADLRPLIRPGMDYVLVDPGNVLNPDELPRVKRLLRK